MDSPTEHKLDCASNIAIPAECYPDCDDPMCHLTHAETYSSPCDCEAETAEHTSGAQTPEEIAGFEFYNKRVMGIKRAITEAVEAKQEACAKVVDNILGHTESHIAAAIRARGK